MKSVIIFFAIITVIHFCVAPWYEQPYWDYTVIQKGELYVIRVDEEAHKWISKREKYGVLYGERNVFLNYTPENREDCKVEIKNVDYHFGWNYQRHFFHMMIYMIASWIFYYMTTDFSEMRSKLYYED